MNLLHKTEELSRFENELFFLIIEYSTVKVYNKFLFETFFEKYAVFLLAVVEKL
jgi:hypothetical protein